MMKQLTFGLLFWGLFSGLCPAQDTQPTHIKWEKPFRHKQTGIILPKEIGAYHIVEKARYGKSSFEGNDVSVRYLDGDVKIDVYFYNTGQEKLEDDENHETIINVIKGTLNYIKESEGEIYNEVDIPDEMEVTDFGGDKFSMVHAMMRYREANKDPEIDEKWKKKQESTMALAIFSKFFVKIRHSFLIPDDEKELEAERKNRDEFQSIICSLIAETDLMPKVTQAIANYKKDPTDKDAMAMIVGFAEASKLIHITVSMTILPFFGKDDFRGSEILLAAFIAGNMEAQLENLDFQSRDFSGVRQMLKSYQILRQKNAVDMDPTLEKWAKLNEIELKSLIKKLVNEEKE